MAIKSIQELIEMKQAINDKRNEIKTMFIPSLDTEVTFKTATRAEVFNVRKMEEIEIDVYLIYSHMIEPNLKDKELQETFNSGCKPHMIIDKMFDMEEISKLSLSIIGKDVEEMTKDLKN
jgi:hypothetical protein